MSKSKYDVYKEGEWQDFLLVSKEWKASLEPIPTKSDLTLKSLYDLLYTEDDDGNPIFWYDKQAQVKIYENASGKIDTTTIVGTNLAHDIISLNNNIYSDIDGSVELDSFDNPWKIFGIDIAIPEYDKRARQQFVTNKSLQTGVCFFNLNTSTSAGEDGEEDSSSWYYFSPEGTALPDVDAVANKDSTYLKSYFAQLGQATAENAQSIWKNDIKVINDSGSYNEVTDGLASNNGFYTGQRNGVHSKLFSLGGYFKYDKESAIPPGALKSFCDRGIGLNGPYTSYLTKEAVHCDGTANSYVPPTVGIFNTDKYVWADQNLDKNFAKYDNSPDIVIANEDTAFKGTLVVRENYSAYNTIYLNPYREYTAKLIFCALGLNPYWDARMLDPSKDENADKDTVASSKLNMYRSWTDIQKFIFQFVKYHLADCNSLSEEELAYFNDESNSVADRWSVIWKKSEETWFDILKNTYVWVRAPFYGDYIQPKEFNQDLNQSAKVRHSELMLSSTGDFNKYDEYIQSYNKSAESDNNNVNIDKEISYKKYYIDDNGTIQQKTLKTVIKDTEYLTDFNNAADANKTGRSENTEPWIPHTSPSVDILTSKFVQSSGFADSDTQKKNEKDFTYDNSISADSSEKIDDFIKEKVNIPNPIFKSYPVASVNRKTASDNRTNASLVIAENGEVTIVHGDEGAADYSNDIAILPPNWFDPESRKSGLDYAWSGKMPSIIPHDGNAYVDGRIFSPTIDEIWYMVKKMVDGRRPDVGRKFSNDGHIDATVVEPNVLNERMAKMDTAVPFGNAVSLKNDVDTTLAEATNTEFNFKYEDYYYKHDDSSKEYIEEKVKLNSDTGSYETVSEFIERDKDIIRHGDPIDFTFDYQKTIEKDDNGNSVVTQDVNSKKIVVNKFVNKNDAIVYPLYQAIRDLSARITEFDSDKDTEKDRSIYTFTAYDSTVDEYGNLVTTGENGDPYYEDAENPVKRIKDKQIVTSGIWAPREEAYSLRELEALIMGEKFNLVSFMRFVKENFTVSGKLGKHLKIEVTDNGEIIDLDECNVIGGSIYQMHKDYNYQVDRPNTYYNNYADKEPSVDKGARAEVDDDNYIPHQIREEPDYGTAKTINSDQTVFSSADVYMGADGRWHYVFDHLRIPIVKCEY